MWFLGVAWVPRPFVLTASSRGTLALAVSQGTHPKFLARTVKTQFFRARIFYIDIPFHYHLFPFNLYPIALKCCANVLRKFYVISFMQSAFTIRNMDSTPEPPSPNMAAADPKQRNSGSVLAVPRACLPFSMITILYALSAETRYVICNLFVMNAATGLLRNARFSLTITISCEPSASPNGVRLG